MWVMFGSFSKCPVTLKRLTIELNRMKFGTRGNNRPYGGNCDLLEVKIFLGTFSAIVSKRPLTDLRYRVI